MAGQRATSAAVAAGVVQIQLQNQYAFLEIINSGSAPIGAVAKFGSAPPDFALGDDDTDVIPAGHTVVIPVFGAPYDPGVGGLNPGTFVKVAAAGSTGLATARAAMGVNG